MDSARTKTALLALFPTERIGPLGRFFEARGYEISVVTVADGTRALPGSDGTSALHVAVSTVHDLQDLAPETQLRLLRPQLIIHEVGADLLAPKIEGEGADWHIDPESSGGLKAAALSWLLDHLRQPSGTLWVNVFAAAHEAHGAAHYCAGRYALAGFEAAMHLSLRLRSMPLINICLTYFGDADAAQMHCAHCLTETHAAAIQAEGGDREAAFRYVERRYGLLGEGAESHGLRKPSKESD